MPSKYQQWRTQRAARQHVEKALRIVGRLSTPELMDWAEQSMWASYEALRKVRGGLEPDTRFQLLCEAQASSDIASAIFEEALRRIELPSAPGSWPGPVG